MSSKQQIPLAAFAGYLALANAAGFEPLVIDTGTQAPGVIAAANASRFVEDNFSEPLTTYAVGFRDPNNIEQTLEFFAPGVETTERFEFAKHDNAQEFYAETDDVRSRGADFKRIEYTSDKADAHTVNKGLTIRVESKDYTPQKGRATVAKLLRRLYRNELWRAIALLSAAATNDDKTWDVTAGKDPDMDITTALIAASDVSGIRPNRVGFGDTAWNKRWISHRAQNSAGGTASAGLTPDALAALLMVDQVLISKERRQSAAATKTQILANLVLMFNAMSGGDDEDPSNIKRFWSPVEGGGKVRVYEHRVSAKLIDVTVEHNSNIIVTSTLGIRKLTIS
jgi:hypothetical protein